MKRLAKGIKRPNKQSKSGVRGIYFEEMSNKWKADLSYQKKAIHLGSYADKLDAIKARLESEKKYHVKRKGEMESLKIIRRWHVLSTVFNLKFRRIS